MAVPTQLSDLSATAASNSPAGGDTVGTTMDDFIRAHASIIARISVGTDALATPAIGAATGTSLALGGGTALTTTNRTGTGNLVLATAPTLTGLTVSGGNFVSRGISDTATAVALTLSGSGANSVTIANSATNPTIGTSGGSLIIAPAGLPGLVVSTIASAVNFAIINPSAAGSAVSLVVNGSDTDIPLYLSSKGAQYIGLYTGGLSLPQVFVTHTASADRYITLTGSNGGNPTIGTSAGSLAITPQLNLTSNLHVGFSTAIGAGGVGNPVIALSASSLWICCGSGAPGISAAKGSLYLRSDGSTTNNRMYVNTDGGTTWTAVTTAA